MKRNTTIILIWISLFSAGCKGKKEVPPLSKGLTPIPQATISGTVERVSFRLMIANTPATRVRGLMYQTHLDIDHGMLFLFEKDEIQRFWMKNTSIPLDMIFIDKHQTIVGIVENTTPYSTEGFYVETPSRYVLEINAGLSSAKGFKVGQKVVFEGVPLPSTLP